MNDGASQKTRILSALLCGEELSQDDIRLKFGCARAAARIKEIRKMGYKISNLGGGVGGTHKYKVVYAIYKYIKPEPVQGKLF